MRGSRQKIPLAELSKTIDDGEKFVHHTTEEECGQGGEDGERHGEEGDSEVERKRPEDKIDQGERDTADATQSLVFAMEDRRYRGEGALNNALGYLYEARVYWSSAESNKFRKKSELLSYAMLVAQIGAVAASLALSRKKSWPALGSSPRQSASSRSASAGTRPGAGIAVELLTQWNATMIAMDRPETERPPRSASAERAESASQRSC
ncbi:MAG: hypothetical protein U0792_02925 [Gemmataceae bacterium]